MKAEHYTFKIHDYAKKIKLVDITREIKQSLEDFTVHFNLNHNQHTLAIVQLFKDSLINHPSLVALLYKNGDAYKAAAKVLKTRYQTIKQDLREVQDTCAHLKMTAIMQIKKELLNEFQMKLKEIKVELYKDLKFIYNAVFSERQGTQDILLNLQQTVQVHCMAEKDYKNWQRLLECNLKKFKNWQRLLECNQDESKNQQGLLERN